MAIPIELVDGLMAQARNPLAGMTPVWNNGPGAIRFPPPSTEAVRVGQGVVESATRPQRYLPAAIPREGVRVGEGVVSSAGRPVASGVGTAVEVWKPPVAPAAQAAANGGRAGLMAQLRGAAGSMRMPTRAGGIAGVVGAVGGNMLDSSQLLGGDESVANDTASKMLKWGGLGATVGSIFPGVGTVTGGAIGAGVGAGHEFLERQGILGGPDRDTRINNTIQHAVNGATGVPASAMEELRRQYEVTSAYAESPQEQEVAAEEYAAQIEQYAQQAALDPTPLMNEEEMLAAAPVGTRVELPPEQLAAMQQMMMQDTLARVVQPYAQQWVDQSGAAADAMLASAPGGQAGALLRSQAEQFRANGSRDAMNITNYAAALPALTALQNQASMLNQLTQQHQQQAMSAVTSGSWQDFLAQQQAGSSGGIDLAALGLTE